MTEIEHIYITHWKPLVNRKSYLVNRLKKLGLFEKTTFMEMWDRNDPKSQKDKDKYYKINNIDDWVIKCRYNDYEKGKKTFRNLYKGEIFNFLNHYECYKDMQKRGFNNALILEDDSILKDNFSKLPFVLKRAKKLDWDIIFIGECCHKYFNWSKDKQRTDDLYETGFSNTADAYFLSKKGVNTILQKNKFPFSSPIDNEMTYWFINFNMMALWTREVFVIQGSCNSGKYGKDYISTQHL